MEENKYLPPKYSEGFKDLAEALGYNEKTAKSQVTLSTDSQQSMHRVLAAFKPSLEPKEFAVPLASVIPEKSPSPFPTSTQTSPKETNLQSRSPRERFNRGKVSPMRDRSESRTKRLPMF